jgi:hypothetical protein
MVDGCVGSGLAVAVFSGNCRGAFGDFEQAVSKSVRPSVATNVAPVRAIPHLRGIMNNLPLFSLALHLNVLPPMTPPADTTPVLQFSSLAPASDSLTNAHHVNTLVIDCAHL